MLLRHREVRASKTAVVEPRIPIGTVKRPWLKGVVAWRRILVAAALAGGRRAGARPGWQSAAQHHHGPAGRPLRRLAAGESPARPPRAGLSPGSLRWRAGPCPADKATSPLSLRAAASARFGRDSPASPSRTA